MNNLVLSLAVGGLMTLASTAFPYAYCHNGRARGYPFAAVVPACEATSASFGLGRLEGVQVVDVPRALGDIVLWSGAAFGVLGWAERRRRGGASCPRTAVSAFGR